MSMIPGPPPARPGGNATQGSTSAPMHPPAAAPPVPQGPRAPKDPRDPSAARRKATKAKTLSYFAPKELLQSVPTLELRLRQIRPRKPDQQSIPPAHRSHFRWR